MRRLFKLDIERNDLIRANLLVHLYFREEKRREGASTFLSLFSLLICLSLIHTTISLRSKRCVYTNSYECPCHSFFLLFFEFQVAFYTFFRLENDDQKPFSLEKTLECKQNFLTMNWQKSGPVRPDRFQL